ncbi:tRNA (adenosine(37)-N6)-threonylcarbamoyltransferase complex dimerization subunit type 1 TsaB [Candidatus Desantisbacteria bacterium CG1_02_38_46]|uniref:tRNA (Adenosine(37)-N6)-threonylcarbamoyltransferase complex dimerization subunit type 1 TsaB n=1 Tax=Candidatus Desantisbacteria bacterium CG1_02_38_46 TaxID=1817893 RepID=A0A1J4SDK9_9BACT|nr:MAG: tRNA (adenosine(37)-N6)-threonylcarbamoyltransferase complex dimerization subunit type 1 TsaB [Candidatus Desantisbacteria bacterium CG1_02_38_46]
MTNDKSLLILGIDTSGEYCSVGLVQGERVLGEISESAPQKHSDQLIPFIDKILKDSHLKIQDVDGIAVSLGPGSFTGLRVGVATAKALAQGLEIPIVGVRTLDMIALNAVEYCSGRPWSVEKSSKLDHYSSGRPWSVEKSSKLDHYSSGRVYSAIDSRAGYPPKAGRTTTICPIVDARKQQIYTAVYKIKSKSRRTEEPKLKKMTKDLVLTIDEFFKLLMTYNSRLMTVFIGNAIPVYGDVIKEKLCGCPPGVGGGGQAIFATKELWYPRASNIALAGLEKLQQNKKGDNLFKLKPIYLREPDIRAKALSYMVQG